MCKITNILDINDNIELWGSKAVGLWKLKNNGFTVPEGFVIPCDFYKKYISGVLDIIEFEKMVRQSIFSYWDKEEAIIFRSSANIEGIEGLCCCGVFNSIIHNETQKYIDDVKYVWNSVNTEEALAYLKLMGISSDKVKMAIIVQKIQVGAISGILHTYDLVSATRQTIIEWEYQALNAVVDGSTNAEMLILDSDKNLVQGSYPRNITKQCFHNLVDKSYEIETIFSEPVEIEFQLSEKQVYFTQVRKLT